MKVLLFSTVLTVAWMSTASSPFALDIDRYQAAGAFGVWHVLCDQEADMGGTTYFDCVVRSIGEPAIVISSLQGAPVVSRMNDTASGRLVLATRAIDFADCPDGLCPLAESAEEAVALLSDSAAMLEAGDRQTAIAADGLADAVDLVLRRLD